MIIRMQVLQVSAGFKFGKLKQDMFRRATVFFFATLLFGAMLAGPVGALHAETLNDALSSAYQSNPAMAAEQARLRATDEGVAQAQSGYRPNVSLGASAGRERNDTKPSSLSDGRVSPYGYSVTVTQPLFRGFRTINGIKQAKSSVMAGRASLRSVEQDVLSDAVVVFMNMVRETAVLQLRQNNLSVLARQLRATQDRFSVGEVTTTDVAQARARSSQAESALNLARANLLSAQAEYQRVIGHRASRLGRPGTIRKYLPRTQAQAIEWAMNEHPLIEQALFAEKAARHNVDLIAGERLPEVSLEAQYSQNFDGSPFVDRRDTASIYAQARVPLYQSGAVYSRIRQAKQTVLQRRAELSQIRLQVRSAVISAFAQLEASRAQIVANQVAVRANRTALSGVREEEKVGQRTVLDVLDAEQDYLNSQVTLVTTQRDAVVAEYNLLASIGRLGVATLPVSTVIYDPVENFSRVDRKWRGSDINHPDLDSSRLFISDDVFDRRESLK